MNLSQLFIVACVCELILFGFFNRKNNFSRPKTRDSPLKREKGFCKKYCSWINFLEFVVFSKSMRGLIFAN